MHSPYEYELRYANIEKYVLFWTYILMVTKGAYNLW